MATKRTLLLASGVLVLLLSAQASISRTEPLSSFFIIWSTPPRTFLPRFLRSVESILRWHPQARVVALSNTLPDDFFRSQGLRVAVERYDMMSLLADTKCCAIRGEAWWTNRHLWNQSAYFANHEADLLRLLLLWHRGGVYVDTDVIFLRPLTLPEGCRGAIGIERGDGGHPAVTQVGGDRALGDRGLGVNAILCNAVLAFPKARSHVVEAALERFLLEYMPFTPGLTMMELHHRGEWGAMGPLLITKVLRDMQDSQNNEVCVMEQDAFYPITPMEIHHAFATWTEEQARPILAALKAASVTVHFWNALTRDTPVLCGSLLHRLLEQNCLKPGHCAAMMACQRPGQSDGTL